MKTRLLAVLLALGLFFGNAPIVQAGEWITEAPPLSDLVYHWDANIRLISYDLGPSPIPPPTGEGAGEEVTCDPEIYASVVAAFEAMKALGSIPAELNISSSGPNESVMALNITQYSPEGTSDPASSKQTSIPFRYQDGSLSGELEDSGTLLRRAVYHHRRQPETDRTQDGQGRGLFRLRHHRAGGNTGPTGRAAGVQP
ncbi:MAG: hypothetical protein NTV33_06905 [Coprothermobacterota bacterium]|nr:hypothetical protein [Coprothermobacterota bacterium]